MNIISIAAYNTESCVVCAKNGKITSAVYEQHFSRKNSDCSFPSQSLRHVLNAHDSIDAILFSDSTHYDRFCKDIAAYSSIKPTLVSTADALAHSAAIVNNSDSSAVIAVNALDAKNSISLGYYNGLNVTWLKHIDTSNCLYSLYTNVLKLMGLNSDKQAMLAARKGQPLWTDWVYNNLLSVDDGDIRIRTSNAFGSAFLDYNIAASAQNVIQDVFVALSDWLYNHLDTNSLIVTGNFSDNTDLISYLYDNTNFTHIATPLDASISATALGAIATVEKPLWETIYLGTESDNGISTEETAAMLLKGSIAPVIYRRTEFNTSSFGNRCFLAIPSDKNINQLNNMLNNQSSHPYSVICRDVELNKYFKTTGNTRYKQSTAIGINTNYNTDDNKFAVQTVNITTNPYINRVLEQTGQFGFPFLICADLRAHDKPLVNTLEDYNNEIQLYN